MLANGITLGMKKSSESSYSILEGLKEVPELGSDPEKVDNTTLSDKNKIYELGIGDPGDLAYKFKWENKSASSSYRKLRAVADTGDTVSFQQKFPDGTVCEFDAQCSLKIGGGGVNAAVEYTLNLAIQGSMTMKDPE